MHVTINASSDPKNSRGKTTRVTSDKLDIDSYEQNVNYPTPKRVKYLRIKAQSEETYSTGFLDFKTVTRDLTISLTADDLAKIFSAAISHGIFDASEVGRVLSAIED